MVSGAFASSAPAQRPLLSNLCEAYLRVNRSVLIQAHCVSKGFPAGPALKWPRPAVRPPHVDLQTVRGGEHLWKNRRMTFFNVEIKLKIGKISRPSDRIIGERLSTNIILQISCLKFTFKSDQ